MKALVWPGGPGTRLRPLTHSLPQQLVPIAGRPVLEHVLAGIRDLGVREVCVVVGDGDGDGAGQIQRALGDGSRLGLDLTCLPQDAPRGLGHALSVARGFLADDDFVAYRGDTLLPGGVAGQAAAFAARRCAARLVVRRTARPDASPAFELGADGRVVSVSDGSGGDIAPTGVHFFTPAVHEAVAALTTDGDGGPTLTTLLRWLLAHGSDVRADEYAGYWRRIVSVEDVLHAHRALLDGLSTAVDGDVDDLSRITGQVVVEPGVRVVRSWIEGPAIIAAGSVVEESHIGPHATIGRDCVVRGTHVDDSVVLDGATIQPVGRLNGSLIGRSAHVAATARHESPGHRLVVGDDTRVEVAA
ncbi:sugar phosphate nucleotidyltransferase [Streptomyces sp. NPDC002888]|uniref:sugar phosphate nucleotidyltransferase n=1 Tax=Streptomyces sp. NPDC002888 TaxID=3364668 RepID=UPI003690BF48